MPAARPLVVALVASGAACATAKPPQPPSEPAVAERVPIKRVRKDWVEGCTPRRHEEPEPEPLTAPVLLWAPEPAKREQHWTVVRSDAGCTAAREGSTPPIQYACPLGFQPGDSLKIILRAGTTECFAGTHKVDCPQP
jgi:hypothetical protein